MATRRKGVTRSRITTRSSKQQLERDQEHQLLMQIPEVKVTATQASSAPSSPERMTGGELVEDDFCCNWSTPKAKRNRIPEIESCPPAPKKQRAIIAGGGDDNGDGVRNCSLRRSSIPFFSPPELAEFFFRSSSPFPLCPQF